MRMMLSACWLLAAVALGVACERRAQELSDARKGAPSSAQQPKLPCLLPDSADRAISLVFSDVIVSSLTGDASGFEIGLQLVDTAWSGWSREATGEVGPRSTLAELRVDDSQHAVQFAIPNGPDSARFTGRISCDSLWGMFKPYRATSERYVAYQRVVRSGR